MIDSTYKFGHQTYLFSFNPRLVAKYEVVRFVGNNSDILYGVRGKKHIRGMNRSKRIFIGGLQQNHKNRNKKERKTVVSGRGGKLNESHPVFYSECDTTSKNKTR